MKRSFWLVTLLIVFISANAHAQETLNAGQSYQLVFAQSTTQPQPGWTIVYKAYVDGQPVDAVSGPVEGSTVDRLFSMPPFTTGGTKNLRVSARVQITDSSAWKCGTGAANLVDCTEVMSAPLAVNVLPPVVPNPDPATNLRIIRTTTVSEVVIDSDGNIVKTSSNTTTQVLEHKQ